MPTVFPATMTQTVTNTSLAHFRLHSSLNGQKEAVNKIPMEMGALVILFIYTLWLFLCRHKTYNKQNCLIRTLIPCCFRSDSFLRTEKCSIKNKNKNPSGNPLPLWSLWSTTGGEALSKSITDRVCDNKYAKGNEPQTHPWEEQSEMLGVGGMAF